jgi:hypothetical protein
MAARRFFDGAQVEIGSLPVAAAEVNATITPTVVTSVGAVPTASFFTGYPAEVVADSPVSYWRFGESSGTNAVDIVGGKNATYVNSPTLGVAGLVNGGDTAVSLDGTDDYITTPFILDPNAGDFSIEVWVKLASLPSSGQAYTIAHYGTVQLIRLAANDGNILATGTFIGGVSTHTMTTDTTHIVLTWEDSATTLRWYVNGVAAGVNTSANQTATSSGFGFGINAALTGNRMAGVLDEAAIYNTVLSGARALAHYEAARVNATPTVVTGVGSVPAPTVTADSGATDATVTPTVVTSVGAVPAPTVTAASNATVTPTVVTGVGAVPAPTVTAGTGSAISAGVVTGVGAVLAPTVTAAGNATITVAVVTSVGSVGSPTVTAASNATVTPAVVTSVGSVGAPVFASNVTVTPTVVTSVGSVGAPTVVAASNVTVTPAVVTSVGSVQSPSVSAAGNVSITTVVVTSVSSVNSPTVAAASNATATPGVINSVSAVESPTVSAVVNATVVPTVVTSVGAVESPALTANADITPSPITATGTIPAVVVSLGAAITPGTITATGDVDSPDVDAALSATVSADCVDALGSVAAVEVVGGISRTITPFCVTARYRVMRTIEPAKAGIKRQAWGGYEPSATPAERRGQFDLRRKVNNLENQ